jgi:hypothetical protein
MNKLNKERWMRFLGPVAVALIAAHTISWYGQGEGVFEIIFVSGYFTAMFFSFVVAFAILMLIYFITVRLDRVYSWKNHRIGRPIVQSIFGVFLVMGLAALAAAWYFSCHDIPIRKIKYFPDYFLMILGYITAINMFFNSEGLSLYRKQGQRSKTEDEQEQEGDLLNPEIKDALLLQLNLHKVVLVFTRDEEIYAMLESGEEMAWDFSLLSTIKVLDANEYCRISRYCIVKRDTIESVKQAHNMSIIRLKPPYGDEHTTGKTYKNKFDAWWFSEEAGT